MGLDMFALRVTNANVASKIAENNTTNVLTDEEKQHVDYEFAYWRKNHHLHGRLKELWESKGNGGDFNCDMLELTEEDLWQILYDIEDGNLEPTEGFFFGTNFPYQQSDYDYDTAFCKRAIRAIGNGDRIFYYAWW